MSRTHRSVRRAVLLAALVLCATVAGRARAAAAAAAADTTLTTEQAGSFEIYAGDHRLGTEIFHVYSIADTILMTSDVRLDGASPGSALPTRKTVAFRQRKFDSYPVAFAAESTPRRDTTRVDRTLVQFADTVAMVTMDRADRGRVESVGLPPGRLYILEPGTYLLSQVLLADFAARSQDERKQSVLIPSLATVIDLDLKRGGEEDILVRGKRVHARKYTMSDPQTTFDAWLDAGGRMWRLGAEGQALHIERGPDEKPAAKTKGAARRTAPSKRTRSATRR